MEQTSTTIDYSEQSALKVQPPTRVTIVGLGGAGSWIALLCAMTGCTDLTLIDGADVKATDLARLPIRPEALGRKKVDAVRDVITSFRPGINIDARPHYFEIGKHEDVLVGTVFNEAASNEMADHLADVCRRREIPHLSAIYFGLNVAVFERRPDSVDISSNPVPAWAVGGAFAAALAVTAAVIGGMNAIVSPERMAKGNENFDLFQPSSAGSM